MILKSLECENYRNLWHTVINPDEGINVICGENAQGKTNILECIWLFTGGRSFRGAKENELIRFGEKYSRIKIEFFSEERDQTLEFMIQNGKRKAVLNDVPKQYLSQIIGKFCAVVFSPNHLSLIKDGPEERRGFIDGALCQIKPSYAVTVTRYRRILNERNALLKDIPRQRELEDTLEVWDRRLASEGAAAAAERIKYMNKLIPTAFAFYDGISGGREKLELQYKMNFGGTEDMSVPELEEALYNSLRKRRSDDIYCGYTTAGIHRDDIIVRINGKDSRAYGSQGQQRSAVLALKLAEAATLGREKGESPIILLDDVLSELDPSRQDYLLRRLSGMQVFITCCEQTVRAENVFRVTDGAVACIEKNEDLSDE